MIKPTLVHVDEPESLALLTSSDHEFSRLVLPKLVDDIIFCLHNGIFENGTGEVIDVVKLATLLSANVVIRNIPQGVTFGRRHIRLTRPLEELAVTLIPILVDIETHPCIEVKIHSLSKTDI